MSNIVKHPAIYRQPIQQLIDAEQATHRATKCLEFAKLMFAEAEDAYKQFQNKQAAGFGYLAE